MKGIKMIARERDKVKFLLDVVDGNYGKDIKDSAREALYEMGVTKKTLRSYEQDSSYVDTTADIDFSEVDETLEINEYEKPYRYPGRDEKRRPSIYRRATFLAAITILFLIAFVFGWILSLNVFIIL